MPPVSQQGSRAGLITTLVVFVILFMVAAIMLIYSNAELTKATQAVKDQQRKYDKVVSNVDLSGEGGGVELINSMKEKVGSTGSTVLDIAQDEIKELTRTISGNASPSFDVADSTAAATATSALQYLATLKDHPDAPPPVAPAASTGATMPPNESLISVIAKQQAVLAEFGAAKVAHQKALDTVKKELATRAQNWDAQIAALQTKVNEAHKIAADAQKALADAQAVYQTKQGEADSGARKTVEDNTKEMDAARADVAKAKAELAVASTHVKALEDQLRRFRMDVKDAAIRQIDGSVIRVPTPTVCYISLGSGDHIPVGITFEVYDKSEGVPGLGADPLSPSGMPAGKASIEVVRVGQNSSECRIVHTTPGTNLSEGDVIANLIYDKNTTYNFFVFGKFDTDGNGVWTAQEAEVVKGLITRWGGKVQDKIGVSTDFAVFGQEPTIPAFTQAEIDGDPGIRALVDKAKADLKAYNDNVLAASALSIPIMNQNRFMYYIGYFDQMKR